MGGKNKKSGIVYPLLLKLEDQMLCPYTMDETWLYHYDPETKQQSMECRNSGSPRPKKIPSEKIRWKSSRLDFLGSRRHPSHWLSSKLSTRSITHLCLCKLRTFSRKNAAGRPPREPCTTAGSPGTCNPEETGLPGLPMSWSPTLFSGSGPVGIPPVPWTEKKIERSPFFVRRGGHCCRGDLVGRTTFWIFFFWVACKS